jgi:hypothetical protein
MTDSDETPAGDQADVFFITYDEDGNESRVLPADAGGTVEISRDLGIGRGSRRIIRIKHGPFVAPRDHLRLVNVGSLAAAADSNYLGSKLYVDLSDPPLDEDVLELDARYHLDVRGSALVAVASERHPSQPTQTADEIAASLSRVVAAYDCHIVEVTFSLAAGGTPDEYLSPFAGGESEWEQEFHAEQLQTLAGMAHDVHVAVGTEPSKSVATLMDGAAAIADFMSATKNGPLDATGVLNLLRGAHFSSLLGATESQYLEAKATLHPIGVGGNAAEKAKIELAQDVARFANADVDAVMVIGFKESSGGGRNQLGSVTPVANYLINPAQIREVLDARIVPPLDGVLVEAFAVTATESVLAIFVPKQPAEMQPYLVHGVVVGDKVEGAFFSIVRRRGEGSIPTTAQQIHTYIVAGRSFLKGE